MTDHIATLVPLNSGDRLSRAEFHRRYLARPDLRRAELLEGVVSVPSPMRFDQHDEPAAKMVAWLAVYAAGTPGVRSGGTASIYLTAHSEVQADGFLFYDPPSWSGGIRRTADGYLEGAPELVVEVAASSAAYDRGPKQAAYAGAGVQEYLVWQTLTAVVEWFRLRDGVYVPLVPDGAGVLHSEVFPGLRLDVAALLAGDRAALLGGSVPPPAE